MDDKNHKKPTFLNIVEAFKALSEEAQPGDAIFIQFSGHGGRVLDSHIDTEAESYDEVLVPCDYLQSGLIRDTLIFKTLLAPMRYGVTVTILIDCCDNGMVLELPYSWSTKGDRRSSQPKLALNEDFSFKRFLKVVRTLYESSSFTQLGRTVDIALNPMNATFKSTTITNDESSVLFEQPEKAVNAASRSSILDNFSLACSTKTLSTPRGDGDGGIVDSTGLSVMKHYSLTKQSLLQQVMNCTLLSPEVDEDFSFDETYQTRTEDHNTFDEEDRSVGYNSSFRSCVTEYEEESRRRGRRRRR